MVGYRQDDVKEVTSSTIRGYIRSLNRVLKMEGYELDMLRHASFKNKCNGLMGMLDNRFAGQQYWDLTIKYHNTLSLDDLVKLLDYAVCEERNPVGYVYRFIIVFGVMLGIRPLAMWELTLDQFTEQWIDGHDVIVYTERIGSRTGGSKTKKGGCEVSFSRACSDASF